MKYALVTYHPYDRSFNAAIVQEVRDAATRSQASVDWIDLAQLDFNPVMSTRELYEFSQGNTSRGVREENLDPVAVSLARRINECDHLFLVFPIWWELMPAPIKGFIDKVVFPKIFYTYRSEFSMKMVSQTLKQVTIITTMNTPRILYRLVFGDAIKRALVYGTFKKVGIRKVRWIGYSRVKAVGKSKREKILKEVAGLVLPGRSISAKDQEWSVLV